MKNMRKFVIRVDSSRKIGSGHLMRCLTLAKRLKKDNNAEVHFISRDLEGNLNHLAENNFILHELRRPAEEFNLQGYAAWLEVPQNIDAAETSKILKKIGKIDRLIIDSYAIDVTWEKILRPFVDEIFVIDDLANRVHDCDFLLDQNFYADMKNRYNGLIPPHCELISGPKYALLREEFYTAEKNLRRRNGSCKNILVFYGGVDATNETMKALNALVKLDADNLTVNVVAGGSNLNRYEIEKFCSNHGFNFYCQVDNMAELMNAADLSLGAGGATTLERLFMQLPTIVTAVADNQIETCENYSRAGFIKYLGVAENVDVDDICRAVEDCLLKVNLLKFLDLYRTKNFWK